MRFLMTTCNVMQMGKLTIRYTYKTELNTNMEKTTVKKALDMYVVHEVNFDSYIKHNIRKANILLGLIQST